MAIEYRNRGTDSGTRVVMTACPFYEEKIPEDIGFTDHWPRCEENPSNGGAA